MYSTDVFSIVHGDGKTENSLMGETTGSLCYGGGSGGIGERYPPGEFLG